MAAHQPASEFRRASGFDHRARPLLIIAALLALAPVAASGAELRTFELPSELVDASTPGGTLEDGRTVPKVHVLLPDGYRADSKRGSPVFWLLHGANGGTDTWIHVPLGVAVFPKELLYARRRWVEADHDVTRWTEFGRGGHFAALEERDLLVDDVRAFFRPLR